MMNAPPPPASEIERYEGRLEFWDARTETGWKVCDVSIQHEQPSRRLVQMVERVAALRGSPIWCYGSADLVRLDALEPRPPEPITVSRVPNRDSERR